MTAKSFDPPSVDAKATYQRIDKLACIPVRTIGQVGIASGGQDTVVAEDFLDFEQINARFDQMSGIGMAKAVRRNSFFKPI
jgi:hypothetical protein